MPYQVRNKGLRNEGKKRIEWALAHMPVLAQIRKDFSKKKPFRGTTVGMALHVEPKTCALAATLKAGGATVAITGCNPLSTQDSAAVSLALDYNINVFTWYGETTKEYYQCINKVLDFKPDVVIDDGCDLIFSLHTKRRKLISNIKGGAEETTTGIHRLKVMEKEGALEFPVIDVNDAQTKYLFDNRYGTGQSSFDGIMSATNLLIAGKTFVVAGYGWCGRGVAMRAKGMGANVVVTEVDPVKSIEATMDGFRVMPMDEAAKIGDIFVTATGDIDVLTRRHFRKMKDGAILSNTGHFNVEINIAELRAMSKSVKNVRENVDLYTLKNNKKIYLLAKGRLVNLAAGQGHPAEVMDMSFANQALSCEYIVKNHAKLGPKLYPVPEAIDTKIAKLWLKLNGLKCDTLTEHQKKYMSSWAIGT